MQDHSTRTRLLTRSVLLLAVVGLMLAVVGPLLSAIPATIITTIVGTGTADFSGDEGAASMAQLNGPRALAVDGNGDLLICDTDNHRIRKYSARTNVIVTVAGGRKGFYGDGKEAARASLSSPNDVAIDDAGNIYIADTGNQRVRKITAGTNIVSTIAGTGKKGFSGDGGPATKAQLSDPSSVAVDHYGNIYVADTGNHRVRRIEAATGIISPYAGSGATDFQGADKMFQGGDNRLATNASLSAPVSLAVDPVGNLYIADTGHRRVRKVDYRKKIISTVAGNGYEINGSGVDAGDGLAARQASFSKPTGIDIDSSGNLYIADSAIDPQNQKCTSSRVRRIDAKTQLIHSFAGDRHVGFAGDGGVAEKAWLYAPSGVAVDSQGNVYIADTKNQRIRKVTFKK